MSCYNRVYKCEVRWFFSGAIPYERIVGPIRVRWYFPENEVQSGVAQSEYERSESSASWRANSVNSEDFLPSWPQGINAAVAAALSLALRNWAESFRKGVVGVVRVPG